MNKDELINSIIKCEGGYSNNPNDLGGETNYGITKAVARENGYTGSMKELPLQTAKDIYSNVYWIKSGISSIDTLSNAIACKLLDIAINTGIGNAANFLQRSLNVLMMQYGNHIVVDNKIGTATISLLKLYLDKRGKLGETVLLKSINSLQGYHYIEITEARNTNSNFIFGWLANRVS